MKNMNTRIINISIEDCVLLSTELEQLQKYPSVKLAMFSNKNLQRMRETMQIVSEAYKNAMESIAGRNEFLDELREVTTKYKEMMEDVEEDSPEMEEISKNLVRDTDAVIEKHKEASGAIDAIKAEYSAIISERNPVELFVISADDLPNDVSGKSIETLMSLGFIE